jgi:hypothetical protein
VQVAGPFLERIQAKPRSRSALKSITHNPTKMMNIAHRPTLRRTAGSHAHSENCRLGSTRNQLCLPLNLGYVQP